MIMDESVPYPTEALFRSIKFPSASSKQILIILTEQCKTGLGLLDGRQRHARNGVTDTSRGLINRSTWAFSQRWPFSFMYISCKRVCNANANKRPAITPVREPPTIKAFSPNGYLNHLINRDAIKANSHGR